jgi:hypothetical protein
MVLTLSVLELQFGEGMGEHENMDGYLWLDRLEANQMLNSGRGVCGHGLETTSQGGAPLLVGTGSVR